MKNVLVLFAGILLGLGLGMELTYWTGRSYGWVKTDFTIMLLAVIIGLNFIGLGALVLWRALRRDGGVPKANN